MNITVIGESNIDIAVKPQGELRQGGCTPGDIGFHHGGVAHNIAHNLRLLGHEVQLATVFGDDTFAESLIDECHDLGIDLSLSSQYENIKSPIFLSFNDEVGNMQSAFSDIELNSFLDLDWLMARIDAINRSDMVVADTLLSTEALAFLIDHCVVPLYIDTVSPNRTSVLSEALKKSWKKSFYALKCNLAEAQALTGLSEAHDAAMKLVDNGMERVYLTLGADGVIFCTRKDISHFPAIETEAVNVTGSGDAFFAGVIHANATNQSSKNAIAFGIEMAKMNCESESTVNQDIPRLLNL